MSGRNAPDTTANPLFENRGALDGYSGRVAAPSNLLNERTEIVALPFGVAFEATTKRLEAASSRVVSCFEPVVSRLAKSFIDKAASMRHIRSHVQVHFDSAL